MSNINCDTKGIPNGEKSNVKNINVFLVQTKTGELFTRLFLLEFILSITTLL